MKEISVVIYDQNIWGVMPGNRNRLIGQLVEEHGADVCCFQECNPKTTRFGDTALDREIAAHYEEVPTAVGARNFTPVFYKRDRFDVVESGYILFEGKNDANSKSVTWAILSEKASGIRFGVCSTHFWWRVDSEEDNVQRLANAKALDDCMTELRERFDVPVFAAGDLNCGERSRQGMEPYLWLCEHLSDVRRVAAATTDTFTHHAYPVKDENGDYSGGAAPVKTLDHAFLADHPHVRVDSFDVDTSQKALDTSDHCPLIIKATISG